LCELSSESEVFDEKQLGVEHELPLEVLSYDSQRCMKDVMSSSNLSSALSFDKSSSTVTGTQMVGYSFDGAIASYGLMDSAVSGSSCVSVFGLSFGARDVSLSGSLSEGVYTSNSAIGMSSWTRTATGMHETSQSGEAWA
jgi:Na+/H+-translocating membrane pyrophosphatase